MPFNLTLVLSVPHVYSRFPLKMENGIQMLGCPDIFLFFSQIFFGIFLQSISWKWQFGHFLSHVSKFIP